MRFFILLLILLAVSAAVGQSGRNAPGATGTAAGLAAPTGDPESTVKQMFEEAYHYVTTKGAEYDAKKIFVSDSLLQRTKLEQRQLAARYALIAGGRKDLAGEDLYYLGRLHYLAENRDATVETLGKFLETEDITPERSQGVRAIIVVTLASQKKTAAAEKMLGEYLGKEPIRLSERVRMERELAIAYQAQKNFPQMVPHADQAYKAAKALLKDATSRPRGLNEILDAGLLLYEAWRDSGNQKNTEDTLEDMRVTAVTVGSPSMYYYAVDQKIKYLIETGRKRQATEYYTTTLAAAAGDFALKASQTEINERLKKRQKHYALLGLAAPELPMVDQWFPGERRTLSSLRGKVVLLDFWAAWCAPCFEAFPSLIEWHQDLGPEGLEILGITRYYSRVGGLPADNPSEIQYLKTFRQKEKLPYDFVVAKDQSIQSLYGGTSLPTAVLIDRKGVIRYIESGTSPTRLVEIREMIIKLLAEK